MGVYQSQLDLFNTVRNVLKYLKNGNQTLPLYTTTVGFKMIDVQTFSFNSEGLTKLFKTIKCLGITAVSIYIVKAWRSV